MKGSLQDGRPTAQNDENLPVLDLTEVPREDSSIRRGGGSVSSPVTEFNLEYILKTVTRNKTR